MIPYSRNPVHKICPTKNNVVVKLNIHTDNSNSWHGVIKVQHKTEKPLALECTDCPNNALHTDRIVVDTDQNRYQDWFRSGKAMACYRVSTRCFFCY